jgi:hypothetical protein
MKALWRLKYLKPDAADSSLPGYAAVCFDIETNILEDTAAPIFKTEEVEASSQTKR